MTVGLTPIHEVARARLDEAAARFAPDERAEFLDGADADLRDDEAFAAACARWRREEREPQPARRVPATRLALVDGERVVGGVDVRHRLTGGLRLLGGHVGYVVVPTERRRGYGTLGLRLALPVARTLGLGTVLVTCHHGNTPSRRIIESAGGVLVDRHGDRLRFVVSTGDGPPETNLDALR